MTPEEREEWYQLRRENERLKEQVEKDRLRRAREAEDRGEW